MGNYKRRNCHRTCIGPATYPLDLEGASVKDNRETVNHANGDNVPIPTKYDLTGTLISSINNNLVEKYTQVVNTQQNYY